MSSNKRDWSGGLFDFNNDGHLDFGEEFLANKMYEDSQKNSSTTNYYRNSNSNTRKQSAEIIIPENPTEAEYKEIRKKLADEKVSIWIVAIIMIIGTIGMFFSAFIVTEHAAFSLMVIFLALFIAYTVCKYISRELNKNFDKYEQLERNYIAGRKNKL